ncbi:MAG: hypothetical protein L0I76_05355 [Pseudonocardia sp.]|nr:hypothetical protein [Pseudonocardia sp.]
MAILSAPSASQLTYDHARELVHHVLLVGDDEAVRGSVELAEHGKVLAEPAAGCLIPAARRILAQTHDVQTGDARVGDVRLGLVLCGGNTTVADLAGQQH